MKPTAQINQQTPTHERTNTMCIGDNPEMFKSEVYLTRNGSVVQISKVNKSGSVVAKVLKVGKKVDEEVEVGTEVKYKSQMGHVLCKGEDETGKECELHPMDAVEFLAHNVASLSYRIGWSPFSLRETQRILARREKWVKALESGKFKQGQGQLADLDDLIPEYCCLGVANHVCKLGEAPYDGILSPRNARKMGLSGDQQAALWLLNDRRGLSFKKIAEKIRSMPLEK